MSEEKSANGPLEEEPVDEGQEAKSGAASESGPDAFEPIEEKADLFKRILAAIIDSIIASLLSGIISSVIPVLGSIIGALAGGAYFLLRDGMNIAALEGKSVGKKIMQLKVIGATDPIDYITSIKRNITLGFIYLLFPIMIIPLLGALVFVIAVIVQIIVGFVELYKVYSDPEGKRIGDMIAETKVVDD